jgi:hypothetical protein
LEKPKFKFTPSAAKVPYKLSGPDETPVIQVKFHTNSGPDETPVIQVKVHINYQGQMKHL